MALRSLSLVTVAAGSRGRFQIFSQTQGGVMSFVNSSMLLAMLPTTGGVHLGWEKKPSQNGNQVIEVKISPDHLDRCKETGICVDGCPSREFLFVGHLLIRK